MRKAFLLLLAAWAFPAVAQTKISIVAFEGPGAATARNQIVAALCEQAECVPQNKVSARGKPDFKKGKKLGVKFFVDGKVVKKGKRASLELTVFNKPGKPKFKKAWPMVGGELGALQLAQAQAALAKAMGLGSGKAPKEEEEKAKEEEEKKPDEEEKKEEKKDEKQDEEQEKKDKKQREKEEREEKKRQKEEEEKAKEDEEKKPDEEEKKDEEASSDEEQANKHIVVAIDLPFEGGGKYFSYTQTTTTNLRSYNAPFTVGPAPCVEFYPLALFSQGLIAGLGVDGCAAFAVGLQSRLPAAGGGEPLRYPTELWRLDFGARFRIRPFAGSDAAIVPAAGLRIHQFKVKPAEDGSVIDGLPGITYTAIKLGVGGEIPIGDRLAFGAAFTAMPLVGFGEIISPAWFPRGGGFGFDITAFMTFKIAGPLHLKVKGYFTRYGLSFETQPTDPYQAAGAVDLHAGGVVAVRLAF